MGEERKVHKVLMGKPERKRPLGRPRRRWEKGSEGILWRLPEEYGVDPEGERESD
jgi:hypothetical protein